MNNIKTRLNKRYRFFLLLAYLILFPHISHACTAFGAITESGTIIGKNRDFSYTPQQFILVKPIQQFYDWHSNPYHLRNQFYAVTYAQSISMGVNQHGLTAIEEDSLPLKPSNNKIYKQKNELSDGKILYGILQNFNTIDEIIPYLSKIFGIAAPNFYQFADAKKILTVQVAPLKNNSNSKYRFSFKILSKKNEYFTHTNNYTHPNFTSINNLASSPDALAGSQYRLKTITDFMSNLKSKNYETASLWFFDTYSNQSSKKNPNQCLNTSIFRSDLKEFKSVNKNIPNNKIYGTLASMIVSNHGNFKTSWIYLMMLDSITTQKDGKQLIKYRKFKTTLEKLFQEGNPKFTQHQFLRDSPLKGICR